MNVVTQSRYSYIDTVERLKASIVAGGGTVFLVLDQAAAAAQAGLTLRPTTLIVFGNPKGGTPLMDAFPIAALDLPLKLAVWEHGGAVTVAHASMADMAQRDGVIGRDAAITALDDALRALASSVSNESVNGAL